MTINFAAAAARSTTGKVLILVLGVLVALAATFAIVAQTSAREDDRPAREIVVSARDYKFNGSNPALTLVPGERVRIKFVNDEPADSGVEHNFKIIGINAQCSRKLKPGEHEIIETTVPASGEYRYTCCAHPGMGGKVILESSPK